MTDRPEGEVEVAYEAIISMGRANAIALLVLPLAFALLLLPYRHLWGSAALNEMFTLTAPSLLLLLLGLALGVGLHELLHAAAFVLVGKAPRSAVRFGFSWKAFAPYAHCRAPLTAGAYRVAFFYRAWHWALRLVCWVLFWALCHLYYGVY